MINEKDKKMLLNLKPDDVTFDLLVDLFSDRVERQNGKVVILKPKVNINDRMILKSGEYFNEKQITTNPGLFIFNKLLVERNFKNVLGYVNEPIDKKTLGKIEAKLSVALLDDVITPEQMVKYLDDLQWLSMKFHSVVSGSFTMNSLKPRPNVIKERNKLLKEHKEALDNGDVIMSAKIEKDLLNMAHKELEHDPGMDLYDSGARGSFGNNFKNISVMKGAIANPITGKSDIVPQSYIEGIRKEDIHKMGNSVISGAYPKAIGTAVAGYFSKQIIAMMQAVELDEKNSDCGSKNFLRTTIHKSQEGDYLYRYVKDGSKLVLITRENISKYTGKPIMLRSPMYCIGDKICNKCAGDLYYKLGIKNAGLTASRASSTLLNMGMKKFHDASTKTEKIDNKKLTI